MNPNLSEFYNAIARRADTTGTQINVTEVARVCSLLFQELGGKSTEEVLALVSHGIAVAKAK